MPWELTTSSRESPKPKGSSLFDYAKPGEAVLNGVDLGESWTLRFDGACWPNGSPDARGGYGFVLVDSKGRTVAEESGRVVADVVTNNVAEWRGLIAGLEWFALQTIRPARLKIEGDSQLVINQFNADWKCRDGRMRALRDEAWRATRDCSVILSAFWIPREENSRADELSELGMAGDA